MDSKNKIQRLKGDEMKKENQSEIGKKIILKEGTNLREK